MAIKKFKVLVVEDSPLTVERYRSEVFEYHWVDFFPEARSALHHLRNCPPHYYDLIVTDLMLPFKSGEGFVFDLQYLDPNQKIAIVSASAESLNVKTLRHVSCYNKPADLRYVIECTLLGKPLSASPLTSENGQRRRHVRYRVEIPLKIEGIEISRAPVKIQNLSLGGFFVGETSILDSAPETLRCELHLLGAVIQVQAQKRWRSSEGWGMQFSNIGHHEYSLIELYLETLKA